MTPSRLNEVAMAGLGARVKAVLALSDRSARTRLPPLASFVTFQVLEAAHKNLSGRSKQKPQQLRGWGVQPALARICTDLTGDEVPEANLEHVGNDISKWLAHRRSTVDTLKDSAYRAAKKKSKVRTGHLSPAERLAAAQQECYPGPFGGVGTLGDGAPTVKKSVPRRLEPEDDDRAVARSLQFALLEAKEQGKASEAVAKAERKAAATAVSHTAAAEGRTLKQARRAEDEHERRVAAEEAECRERLQRELEEKARIRAEKEAEKEAAARAVAEAAALGARRTAEQEAAAEIRRETKRQEDLGRQRLEEALQRKGFDFAAIESKVAALEAGAKTSDDTLARYKRLKNGMAKKKRKAEKVTKKLEKSLPKQKTMKDVVEEQKWEIELLREKLESLRSLAGEVAEATGKLRSMPTFRGHRIPGKNRGGLKLEHDHRVAMLEQLGNGTSEAAAGQNLVSIVAATAPWLNPIETTRREMRQLGFELTTIVETLAAWEVASAYEVKLIGFDETTDLHEPVITSNLQVRMEKDGPTKIVVLKAAYLATNGGTSEAIVDEIESKCFERLRGLLRGFKAHFEKLNPGKTFDGPDPERCSLYRLAGGGAVISDTCNAARKAKRLLAELIQKQAERTLRARMGDAAWEALGEEARAEKLRVHQLDCWQHLRNIILGAMSAAQTRHVKAELENFLDKFSSAERMSTDFQDVLRAIYKEFHDGGRYYKGQGAEFMNWLREHHSEAFFIHIERADGGRQDLDYDAAVPIYVNRPYLVEFLHSRVHQSNHANLLEDFLYQVLTCKSYIAMARANAIIDLRISRPWRWLSGKTHELGHRGWSPIDMNGVADLIDQMLVKAKDDGNVLLDPELDLWQPITDRLPEFQQYVQFTYDQDAVLSPSGRTRHLQYKLALAELLEP